MKENIVCDIPASNLTILQLHALIFIAKSGHTHMREIAEHFHVEMPTATSLLNKLCKMKLVDRLSDKKDRRLVKVTLTRAGKELLKKARTQYESKIDKTLGYLSKEEKEVLMVILLKLINKTTLAYEK